MKKQNIIGKFALLFAFAFIFTSVAYNLSIPVGARAAEVGADTPGGAEIFRQRKTKTNNDFKKIYQEAF